MTPRTISERIATATTIAAVFAIFLIMAANFNHHWVGPSIERAWSTAAFLLSAAAFVVNLIVLF